MAVVVVVVLFVLFFFSLMCVVEFLVPSIDDNDYRSVRFLSSFRIFNEDWKHQCDSCILAYRVYTHKLVLTALHNAYTSSALLLNTLDTHLLTP